MLCFGVTAGQPTPSPATGKTCCGSPSNSDTAAARLRITLIGHVPSPCASAASTNAVSAIPASTLALKNASR